MTWYAVYNGRSPGVYHSWAECQAQVYGYSNNDYRSFANYETASDYARTGQILTPQYSSTGSNYHSNGYSYDPSGYAANGYNGQSEYNSYGYDEPEEDDDGFTTVDPNKTYRLQFDGAARGNPGPAAVGAIITDFENGKEVGTLRRYLGYQTNNYAEGSALLHGLWAAEVVGIENIVIQGDSNVIIQQLRGQFGCNSQNLMQIYNEIQQAASRFNIVDCRRISRNDNWVADKLANDAFIQQDWYGLETREDNIYFEPPKVHEHIPPAYAYNYGYAY